MHVVFSGKKMKGHIRTPLYLYSKWQYSSGAGAACKQPLGVAASWHSRHCLYSSLAASVAIILTAGIAHQSWQPTNQPRIDIWLADKVGCNDCHYKALSHFAWSRRLSSWIMYQHEAFCNNALLHSESEVKFGTVRNSFYSRHGRSDQVMFVIKSLQKVPSCGFTCQVGDFQGIFTKWLNNTLYRML